MQLWIQLIPLNSENLQNYLKLIEIKLIVYKFKNVTQFIDVIASR